MTHRNPIPFLLAIFLCGFPALLLSLIGCLLAGFGLMADTGQLHLDTGLDRSSLIWAGLGVSCIGSFPILVLLRIGFGKKKGQEA